MSTDDSSVFTDMLQRATEASEKYERCMSLSVSQDGRSVELVLDTSSSYYSEWIKGEDGDICLLRDRGTGRVVGCHLPLYDSKLCIHHEGPIRINRSPRSRSYS
jgi:hypothetical protein